MLPAVFHAEQARAFLSPEADSLLHDDELVTAGLDGVPEVRRIAPTISTEMKALSDKLATLQTVLRRFGITKIYIGGGSAPAVLDHFYFGKPLDMRDLDLFVIAGRKVSAEEALQIARAIEAAGLGHIDPKDVHPIFRGDASQGPGGASEVAMIAQLEDEHSQLDFKLYYSEELLKLNGLVDTDTIMIPLDSKMSLEAYVRKYFFRTSPENLAFLRIIRDIHNGYVSWMRRTPKIIHWAEIERDPLVQSIRIARNFGKVNRFEVPLETANRLSRLIAQSERLSHATILKNLLRVLDDKSRVKELRMIQKFGTLRKWFPGLDQRLAEMSDSQLERVLGASRDLESRLEVLLKLAPPEGRLQLVDHADVERELPKLTQKIRVDSAKEILARHFPMSGLAQLELEGMNKDFYRNLTKISLNSALSAEEKKVFLIREILLSQPANRIKMTAVLRSFVPEKVLTQAIHEADLLGHLSRAVCDCVLGRLSAELQPAGH